MGPAGQTGSPLGGQSYVISAGTAHPDEAYKFISFMSSPSSQAAIAEANHTLPTRQSAYQDRKVSSDPVHLGIPDIGRRSRRSPGHPTGRIFVRCVRSEHLGRPRWCAEPRVTLLMQSLIPGSNSGLGSKFLNLVGEAQQSPPLIAKPLLAEMERVPGADNPAPVDTRDNLVVAYREIGRKPKRSRLSQGQAIRAAYAGVQPGI